MSDKETLSKLLDAEAGLLKTHIETMVENKDQEAWDRFAGKILCGIYSNPTLFENLFKSCSNREEFHKKTANECARQADAMMEQRKARMG